jgi:penicillin-binding protein 2
VLERFAPRVRRKLNYNAEHIDLIHRALLGVVNDETGTAYDVAHTTSVQVAGKTGTAQVERHQRAKDDKKRAWYVNRAHAWFAGWAPADKPELAIVVLVEHGGGGGANAAPIAQKGVPRWWAKKNGVPEAPAPEEQQAAGAEGAPGGAG